MMRDLGRSVLNGVYPSVNRLEADQVTKAKFFVVASVVALVGLTGLPWQGARADDADMRGINNRLDRLERAVNNMQSNNPGGGSSDGSASAPSMGGAGSADTLSRLGEIEDQLRSLTGRVEELGHRVDQTAQDLQNYKADSELRFQDLQKGAGAPPAPGEPQEPSAATGPAQLTPPGASKPAAPAAARAAPAAPTVSLPAGTSQVQYDFAIDLLKRGQFPQARDALKQFLQQHPKDALAGNAQYWLGETYYVQGQYKDAADSFLKGYTTYSKSSKAPDSLLKLGMTLSALGQKDAACATFGQLKEQFPQASPAVVARNKQERQKAGC